MTDIGERTKKLLEFAEASQDKTRTSIYVSKPHYDKFTKACKKLGLTTSKVIDTLIVDFLDAYSSNKSK